MKMIVKMIFGSHLYGTDTPKSDKDFKGVYLPSKRELLLASYPAVLKHSTGNDHEKNRPGDVDEEIFSLHRFIELACQGQTVALDMLHAPVWAFEQSSQLWHELVVNRHRFYTRNMTAFLGYCRRQAAKYGIKGSRLASAKLVHEYLLDSTMHFNIKLAAYWDNLPEGEHLHKLPPDPADRNQQRIYQVCGKKFLESARLDMVVQSLNRFIDEYGARARAAERNEGIDWKAVSHALRVAFQLKQLYLEGTITFPLAEATYLRGVKGGHKDYLSEVAPLLEETIADVERLASESTYPREVNRGWWDEWLVNKLAVYFYEDRGSL